MRSLSSAGSRSRSSLKDNNTFYYDSPSGKQMLLQNLSCTISLVILVSRLSISQNFSNFSCIRALLETLRYILVNHQSVYSLANFELTTGPDKIYPNFVFIAIGEVLSTLFSQNTSRWLLLFTKSSLLGVWFSETCVLLLIFSKWHMTTWFLLERW